MLVPTWTPGEVIPDDMYDRSASDSRPLMPLSVQWFLMVGVPIIAALLIGSCIFCCVRGNKKGKRERKARMERLAAAADGTAPAEGVPDAK
jgi:hypothetical protein